MTMELLLEIGCEEIPARFVGPALEQLARDFSSGLSEAALVEDDLRVEALGTPRRLALLASGVAARQPDRQEQLLGPRLEVAYDEQGNPTKACRGFARSKGVDPARLEPVDTPRGRVVGIVRQVEGRAAEQVLPELLRQLLAGLRFGKSMRWGRGEHLFVRPVHWICALAGEQVIEFEFAGVRAGRRSRGHRFDSPGEFEVSTPGEYVEALRRRSVVVRPEERRRMLREQLTRLAEQAGGRPLDSGELAEEIVNLVELPVAVLGSFQERFLRLPREVLVAAMRNHQRYFALEDDQGRLLNAFVAVANTPVPEQQPVRHGFERVLVARLNDAEFFFQVDLKNDPRQLVERLSGMLFQAELGSYGEKAGRLERLADRLLGLVDAGAGKERAERLRLACRLCKTDLLTEMVGEFPELHGIMGEVYARRAGIDERVATAIREHVMPRHSGDELPQSPEGRLVALADRLDTLAGCFGVGLRPSGTADPYGLRRQALGVIAIVIEGRLHLPLRRALELAIEGVAEKVRQARLEQARRREARRAARKKQPARVIDEVEPFAGELAGELLEFFRQRLRQRLMENLGVRADIVDAVLAAGYDDMLDAQRRLQALADFLSRPQFENLAVAFKRVANILKDFPGGELDEQKLEKEQESRLLEVYHKVEPRITAAMESGDFAACLELLAAELRGPVDDFFDQVLVNDPQRPDLQQNRKALLQKVESLFVRLADFSRLQLNAHK